MRSAVTPSEPRAQADARRQPRRAAAGGRFSGTAVLLATAPGGDGGPAAALAWEDTTLLGRLLEQLADIGIRSADVITREAWLPTLEPSTEGRGLRVRLIGSPDTAADLEAVERIVRDGAGPIVVANAEILTQREALAGLLADPRVPTGMLTTTVRRIQRYMGFRTRTRRGRVVSAGSPYHYIHQPNGTFLGVLKVAAADREALADVAARLAALTGGALPAGWREEFDAKAGRWKLALHRRALHAAVIEGDEPAELELAATEEDSQLLPEDVELSPDDDAELARRLAAAEHDVPSLLLCGLVRSQIRLGGSHLRRLFWTRPLTPEDIERAAEDIREHDEDKALLDSAVKAYDGFFTTFFVSPYSKYIARWAARRGWTPNGVTTLSVAIGFAASAAFATGERWGLVAGAVLLQIAFTFDCVDGQLARYTRTFTKLGAWLDSIFDRTKEYAVFAGLAIGASRAGDDVWLLAGAALALQVMRHTVDFSYPAAQHQAMGAVPQPPLELSQDVIAPATAAPPTEPPAEGEAVPELGAVAESGEPAAAPPAPPSLRRRLRNAWRGLDRSRRVRWVKKIIAFPIGERFAAISITAAFFDARTTFIVLLAWGGFAATYTIAGRILRSLGRRGTIALSPGAAATAGTLEAYRDDGPLARALGRIPLPPLPAIAFVLAGLLPLLAVAVLAGDDVAWGVAGALVAWLVLLGGASSGRPLRDRLRWTVPPALRVAEYGGLLWVAAVAGGAAVPAAFALLCAITYRHYDTVYRLRQRGETTPRWLDRGAGGWDGRLVVAYVLAAAGAVPAGFYAAAALLAIVLLAETLASWLSYERTTQPESYDEAEDEEAAG